MAFSYIRIKTVLTVLRETKMFVSISLKYGHSRRNITNLLQKWKEISDGVRIGCIIFRKGFIRNVPGKNHSERLKNVLKAVIIVRVFEVADHEYEVQKNDEKN